MVEHESLFLTATKIKKYVIKQLIIALIHYNLLLIAIRLNKFVIKHFIDVFLFDSIPDHYKTQEICDIVVSLYLFLIVYCPDKSINQKVCDESIDNFLAPLKLISDWFLTSKMIKKRYTAFYADGDLLFFDENSNDVTFCCNEMGFFSINFNNINLDNSFDYTIILIRLFPRHSNIQKP